MGPALAWEDLDVVEGRWPSGTVTLVLGDIESSTERWEASPTEMAAAMARFKSLVDEVADAHDGVRAREQGEGDNFVLAFSRCSDALRFAVEVQRRSDAGPTRPRIGLHTGEVATHPDGSHDGPTIIRAARIRDVGHGGQVLLSNATSMLAADHLEEASWLLDLGEHELKGLSRRERIWQLCHPDLRADHPAALRIAAAAPPPLPPRVARFIGREEEVAQVRALLTEPGCVTITGAGGCGKTRLVLELLTADQSQWSSVAFVDLAPVNDPVAVATAVADVLGTRIVDTRPAAASLAVAIGDRRALLVLDNCEHLLPACAELTEDLLARCPTLTVLTTSREPLGLAAEVTYRLRSLSQQCAHDLFVDRARRADPTFEPGEGTAPVIDAICDRLDGMPLAIELAAARVRAFSAEQILDVLRDRFRLLTGGSRSALPRQRTLEASVDWSHALLLEAERVLLRRLSVFAGSFSMDAAQAVAVDQELPEHHVLDLLGHLVDKSLVVPDDADRSRYRLLETIRHYAAGKLLDAGEAEECRARHHRWFLDRTRGGPDGWPTDDAYRRAVVEDEVNLRRALQWAAEQVDHTLLLDLVVALHPYWAASHRAGEGAGWCTLLLERLPASGARTRATVLALRSELRAQAGPMAGALDDAWEALRLAHELGEDEVLLQCLVRCQRTAMVAGPLPPGDTPDATLELATRLGDRRAQALALQARGYDRVMRDGQAIDGLRMLDTSSRLAAEIGATTIVAINSAFSSQCKALFGGGASLLPEMTAAAASLRELGEAPLLLNVLAMNASWRAAAGDDAGARRDLEELDVLAEEIGGATSRPSQALGHGLCALYAGDFRAAIDHLAWLTSIPLETPALAQAASMLAIAYALDGRREDAEELAERLASSAVPAGGLDEAAVACVRSALLLDADEPEQALDDLLAAALLPTAPHTAMAGSLLALLARTSTQLGHHEQAARLLGLAESAARAWGQPRTGLSAALLAGTEDALRGALGDAAHAQLVEQGGALTWDDAIGLLHRGRGPRQRTIAGWSSLTPTELDVARLVASGLSNKDVADRLFIGVATVKTHLTHIYDKVGVTSRAQLAAQGHRLP